MTFSSSCRGLKYTFAWYILAFKGEIILASNANIGGPTTAAGMAIAQGWSRLVGPCMLVGTLGYAIGTWLGILVGTILGA